MHPLNLSLCAIIYYIYQPKIIFQILGQIQSIKSLSEKNYIGQIATNPSHGQKASGLSAAEIYKKSFEIAKQYGETNWFFGISSDNVQLVCL